MTLEQRIQRLEDIEAVRDTWHDYMLSLDSKAWDDLADVFTEDGVVEMVALGVGDGVYHGRESIVNDFYRGFPPPERPQAATGHHGTNLRVQVDGDEATTIAYFFEIVRDNLLLVGTYQHRMRRDPDRWRIASLRITITYRCELGVSEPWAQAIGEVAALSV
jgi:hypothetical protein